MVLVNLHIEVHRNAVNLMMLSKNCVLWVNTPNGKMLNSGQEIKVERWARERERERDGGRGSGGKFELDRVLSKIGGWGQKWVCGDRKKNQCSSRPELVSSFHASSFPVISSAVNTLLKDRSTGTASHAVMAEKARLTNLAENLHSQTPKCGTRRKGPEL